MGQEVREGGRRIEGLLGEEVKDATRGRARGEEGERWNEWRNEKKKGKEWNEVTGDEEWSEREWKKKMEGAKVETHERQQPEQHKWRVNHVSKGCG